MDSLQLLYSILADFGYILFLLAALTIWVVWGDMRSRNNRKDIDEHKEWLKAHSNEIKDIQNSLTRQESRSDQLFEMLKETRDLVKQILDRMMK